MGGGGPLEVDTGVKSLSRDLHHNLKITLEIKRRFVAQRGMFPTVVITDNPPEYLSPALLLRSPTPGPLQRLTLQRGIERLSHRIVGT